MLSQTNEALAKKKKNAKFNVVSLGFFHLEKALFDF